MGLVLNQNQPPSQQSYAETLAEAQAIVADLEDPALTEGALRALALSLELHKTQAKATSEEREALGEEEGEEAPSTA